MGFMYMTRAGATTGLEVRLDISCNELTTNSVYQVDSRGYVTTAKCVNNLNGHIIITTLTTNG